MKWEVGVILGLVLFLGVVYTIMQKAIVSRGATIFENTESVGQVSVSDGIETQLYSARMGDLLIFRDGGLALVTEHMTPESIKYRSCLGQNGYHEQTPDDLVSVVVRVLHPGDIMYQTSLEDWATRGPCQ